MAVTTSIGLLCADAKPVKRSSKKKAKVEESESDEDRSERVALLALTDEGSLPASDEEEVKSKSKKRKKVEQLSALRTPMRLCCAAWLGCSPPAEALRRRRQRRPRRRRTPLVREVSLACVWLA